MGRGWHGPPACSAGHRDRKRRREQFQEFCSHCKNLKQPNCAPASWIAAALCRYCVIGLRWKSGIGLPQSKTSRRFPAGFQNPATFLIKPFERAVVARLLVHQQFITPDEIRRDAEFDGHDARFTHGVGRWVFSASCQARDRLPGPMKNPSPLAREGVVWPDFSSVEFSP